MKALILGFVVILWTLIIAGLIIASIRYHQHLKEEEVRKLSGEGLKLVERRDGSARPPDIDVDCKREGFVVLHAVSDIGARWCREHLAERDGVTSWGPRCYLVEARSANDILGATLDDRLNLRWS